jgi:hypothetical protein
MTSLSKHFMATLVFLGSGTMVLCLKHAGITDLDRERLKMSVKTLASWSARARSTRPGNPCGLVNVFRNSWSSHACFSVISLEASIEVV